MRVRPVTGPALLGPDTGSRLRGMGDRSTRPTFSSRPRPGALRLCGPAVLGVASCFVAFLVAVPAYSFGAPAPTVRSAPPYAAVNVSTYDESNLTGCRHTAVRVPATFNASTGFVGFSEIGRATGCVPRFNDASDLGYVLFQIPVRAPAGHRTITVHWRIAVHASENLSAGVCAGGNASGWWTCDQRSEAFVSMFGFLWDMSNHSQYWVSASWTGFSIGRDVFSGCAGPFYGCGNATIGTNGTYSFAGSFTWTISATIVSSHVYHLYVDVDGGEWAFLDAPGSHIAGGVARSQLDFGVRGTGLWLTSITVH